MKILHLQFVVSVAGIALIVLGCEAQKQEAPTPRKLPTRDELIRSSEIRLLSEITSDAVKILKIYGILGGEHIGAVMFELDVNIAKQSDNELMILASQIPPESVGALYYFLSDKKAAEISHPKFYGLLENYKKDSWPAVLATKRDIIINGE